MKTNNEMKLNKYEEEIVKHFDNQNNFNREKTQKEQAKIDEINVAIANTKQEMQDRKKSINLRVSEYDIFRIKKQAKEHGIPYQTLITAMIRKMANSQIEINLK